MVQNAVIYTFICYWVNIYFWHLVTVPPKMKSVEPIATLIKWIVS